MSLQLTLTGDVNLMNVTDPHIPFKQVHATLGHSDLVFSNLECCLYTPPQDHSVDNEGFYADPHVAGLALAQGHIQGVGLANNVNYGSEAILNSIRALDALGIGHTGAGANLEEACKPCVIEKSGLKIGFLARTSVYWNTHHEARKNTPGVAVLRGHTAYQVPAYKVQADIPPMNRPGIPPVIVTWADPAYLQSLETQIKSLKKECDFVVVSCHWGLWQEVLGYMKEIAHAAINAGADIVFGHGPHDSLPVEMYQGHPIFYGLGSFSFHTGHNGRTHGDWVGMMPQFEIGQKHIESIAFKLVRHNEHNETYFPDLTHEQETLERLTRESAILGCHLEVNGDRVEVLKK
jgi:poly-gamma-glutamate capsule biosynthesis protein CapA/YwtB (metallophosphatase superfamily)